MRVPYAHPLMALEVKVWCGRHKQTEMKRLGGSGAVESKGQGFNGYLRVISRRWPNLSRAARK